MQQLTLQRLAEAMVFERWDGRRYCCGSFKLTCNYNFCDVVPLVSRKLFQLGGSFKLNFPRDDNVHIDSQSLPCSTFLAECQGVNFMYDTVMSFET
jgi:hypothetical protein